MAINIGDTIIYIDEDKDGECIQGEIVDIWRNDIDKIIGYFASLDSGLYVHLKPDSLNWFKLAESVLVS
jgi:hypothetical protein